MYQLFMNLQLLFKYNRYVFAGILAIIGLFLISAFIPRKWGNYSKENCNYRVCVSNTGIHSNILVSTENTAHNCHPYISVDQIGIDAAKNYEYLSFGWGDKDFYMSVSDFSDLNFSTTFKLNLLFSSLYTMASRKRTTKLYTVPVDRTVRVSCRSPLFLV